MLQHFPGVPFGLDAVPDPFYFSVTANQHAASHDSLVGSAHEFFHPPEAVRFDRLVVWIAQEREVKLVLFLETRQSFHRIGAHAKNLYLQSFESLLCVAKLGRFHRSTGSVGLGKEKEQSALTLQVSEGYFFGGFGLQLKIRRLHSIFQHNFSRPE
jgi:hypothetical protein